MNNYIVVAHAKTHQLTCAVKNREFTVEVPRTEVDYDIEDFYNDQTGVAWCLVDTPERAQALAESIATRKAGASVRWYKLEGLAQCKTTPPTITLVNDKGALPT